MCGVGAAKYSCGYAQPLLALPVFGRGCFECLLTLVHMRPPPALRLLCACRFQRSVLRKGQLLKRGKAGALFGDRYAVSESAGVFVYAHMCACARSLLACTVYLVQTRFVTAVSCQCHLIKASTTCAAPLPLLLSCCPRRSSPPASCSCWPARCLCSPATPSACKRCLPATMTPRAPFTLM